MNDIADTTIAASVVVSINSIACSFFPLIPGWSAKNVDATIASVELSTYKTLFTIVDASCTEALGADVQIGVAEP